MLFYLFKFERMEQLRNVEYSVEHVEDFDLVKVCIEYDDQDILKDFPFGRRYLPDTTYPSEFLSRRALEIFPANNLIAVSDQGHNIASVVDPVQSLMTDDWGEFVGEWKSFFPGDIIADFSFNSPNKFLLLFGERSRINRNNAAEYQKEIPLYVLLGWRSRSKKKLLSSSKRELSFIAVKTSSGFDHNKRAFKYNRSLGRHKVQERISRLQGVDLTRELDAMNRFLLGNTGAFSKHFSYQR